MKYLSCFAILAVLSMLPQVALAQNDSDSTNATRVVEPDPADVASIDAITRAVYESISGAKGVPRQWDRFRSLFAPDARLIPSQKVSGKTAAFPMDIETYITRAEQFFLANGFFENEIYRKTERYGSLAHYFSTYESRYAADEKDPFTRGINNFQAVHDGERWWIINIYWLGETEEFPIPAEYLPDSE